MKATSLRVGWSTYRPKTHETTAPTSTSFYTDGSTCDMKFVMDGREYCFELTRKEALALAQGLLNFVLDTTKVE